jgi:putative ABC transport system ATP-binding protein
MAPVVSLRGVSRRYVRGTQRVEALRDVDLEIEGGTFVALLGPTGSGKTTLLNLIAGLDTPHVGTVVVSDERIDTLTSRDLANWRARHVGLVFPFDHLVPTLTIERNVEVPLLATELSRYERRRVVLMALGHVGLSRHAQRMPDQLPERERRCVALARALVTQPALLVCDDPTHDVVEGLYGLNERLGTTIVMATDDPLAACGACRVVHISEGRIDSARLAQEAA